MSLKGTIIGLLREGAQSEMEASNDTASFETVQRARFLFVNLIGVCVAATVVLTVAIGGDLFPLSLSVKVTFFAMGYHIAWLFLAYRVRNISMVCRVWVVLCATSLWFDITNSGGVLNPLATLYILLPIGAGLLLGLRDVLVFTIGTAIAVAMTGVLSINNAPPELHSMLFLETTFLVVSTLLTGASIIVLVTHFKEIDNKRRSLLRSKEYIASHDGLTGLSNRSVVTEKLSSLLPEEARVNIFLTDLDKFKEINDAYGHKVGDMLLQQVASRLKAAAPDGAIVARLGGDEFLVLAQADEDGNSIGFTAGGCPGMALVRALSEPFSFGNLKLKVSGSVGIAHFPADADTGEDLLHRADLALYKAKALGRNRCVGFSPYMETEQNRRLTLQSRLREALNADEITLHYQPQFCLKKDQVMGFEALARWNDSVLGVIDSETFITIAEECGTIEQLGEQVLRRACIEAGQWPLMSADAEPLRLSVNISALQLKSPNIVSRIASILAETGFPAERLELEITESVLIAEPEEVSAVLNKLASLGITIAMDDFGKGYSSLSYLQNFSLSRLKIDRSFIANLQNENGGAIVRAIIQLAKAMNLTVIAEGVETEAQRDALLEMGCHITQGFLYAPGLAPDDAVKLIIEQSVRAEHKNKPDPDEPAGPKYAAG